jgi:hypothetical protein
LNSYRISRKTLNIDGSSQQLYPRTRRSLSISQTRATWLGLYCQFWAHVSTYFKCLTRDHLTYYSAFAVCSFDSFAISSRSHLWTSTRTQPIANSSPATKLNSITMTADVPSRRRSSADSEDQYVLLVHMVSITLELYLSSDEHRFPKPAGGRNSKISHESIVAM